MPAAGETKKLLPPVWKEMGDYKERIDNGALLGYFKKAAYGQDLAASSLKQLVSEAIIEINKLTEGILQASQKMVMQGEAVSSIANTESTSKYVSSFAPAILNFMKDLNIPPKDMDFICKEKYQMFLPAYAPVETKINGQEVRMFKYVLFLEKIELGKLVNQFDQLVNSSSSGIERENLKNAWYELLRMHVGNLSRAELEALPMPEVQKKVFGIPSNNNLLKDLRLQDITDKAMLPDLKFRNYVNKIKNQYNQLKKIFDEDRYEYSFKNNEVRYYWISEDFIP